MCEKIGDEWVLSAQLTLSCEDSSHRSWWVSYASITVAVYPAGVPALLFGILRWHRAEINRIKQAVETHEQQRGTRR